jgi:hypothetical protein
LPKMMELYDKHTQREREREREKERKRDKKTLCLILLRETQQNAC